MSVGRRPHDEPHKKKTFYLPESLISRVDMRLDGDLIRGLVPKHGAWSSLVTQLLRDWVTKGSASADPTNKGENE